MGPPPRSFAADAHDCIMVRVLGPTGYKVVARLIAPERGLPSDRHPDRTKRAVVLEAVKVWPGNGGACRKGLVRRPTLTVSVRASGKRGAETDRTKKLTKEKRFAALANFLTKKAPYKETAGGVERPRVRRYGDLTAVVPDCEHNLCDMARTLRMGENTFCRPCNFKELRVVKRAHITTCALCA